LIPENVYPSSLENTQPVVETGAGDPLLANISLPFFGTFYPVGFRLLLSTNCREVLAAAEESWGGCAAEFESEPLEMRVIVANEGALSPQPVFRRQRHLLSVVGDADNFAVADLERLFSYIFISAQTAADHTWLRWFYVESMAYTLLAQRHIVPAHAALVARNGRGILLCGASGAGKSTLAYACARAGWTFLSDDCTWLLPGSRCLEAIGRPEQARFRPDAASLFPELARFSERARPNGKISLEVPLRGFPRIRTARRSSIQALAFLDRNSGPPAYERISAEQVLDLLMLNRAAYSEEVDAFHEKTFRSLTDLPAYRLRYATPEEGMAMLQRVTDEE
jgi:hypothetical protein